MKQVYIRRGCKEMRLKLYGRYANLISLNVTTRYSTLIYTQYYRTMAVYTSKQIFTLMR